MSLGHAGAATPRPGLFGDRSWSRVVRDDDRGDRGRHTRSTTLAVVTDPPQPHVLRVCADGFGRAPWPAAGHRTLRGRDHERRRLDELLQTLRAGRGSALVARGPTGAGKTALLDDLAERATGCSTIRVAGVPTETRLPYAGLHQLCFPELDRLARLPATHAQALRTALGLHDAALPSPLLVGLGLLSLLVELAGEQPLLCLIDDAHWLDAASAQALGVAARRLGAHPIATVIAVRDRSHDEHLASLPALRVAGLDDADAGAVLDGAVATPLDERVRARLLAESRGNPGALMDAVRDVPATISAGGLGLAVAAPIDRPATGDDPRQFEVLPAPARRWLLIAALEPFGDPAVVLRAASIAGLGASAADAATHAGLLTIDGFVRFRDPYLRRVVHAASTPQERQEAHRVLAEASATIAGGELSAWHLGHATAWPDEAVAGELEAAADHARARARTATGAALMQRAAELTLDPAEHARRALIAAEAMHDAGAEAASARLLTVAQAGPLTGACRARARLLRGRIDHAATRGDESAALLLDATQRLRSGDEGLAGGGYRDALLAAIGAGAFARPGTIVDVAATIAERAAELGDPLLAGLCTVATGGYAAAAPLVTPALARGSGLSASLPALRLGCVAARAVIDDAAWDRESAWLLQRARQTGAAAAMPVALTERLVFELLSGRLGAALALAEQLRTTVATSRARASTDPAVWLAAWRGRADEAVTLVDARRPDVVERGHGQWLAMAGGVTAMALNGIGEYEAALAHAAGTDGHPHDVGIAYWLLPELVEAAARSGNADRAHPPARRLAHLAAATRTDWALGLAARSAALLEDGAAAETLYREAIAHLTRTSMSAALARAQLLYGEWLRREGRRVDARAQLRIAHERFTDMGADGFAERARRELAATGETVRRRTTDTPDDLTPQELQIARLAAAGQTNREIGAQLFLSPRTVEWHLRKVFGKLGVGSRRALSSALTTTTPT